MLQWQFNGRDKLIQKFITRPFVVLNCSVRGDWDMSSITKTGQKLRHEVKSAGSETTALIYCWYSYFQCISPVRKRNIQYFAYINLLNRCSHKCDCIAFLANQGQYINSLLNIELIWVIPQLNLTRHELYEDLRRHQWLSYAKRDKNAL